MSAPHLTYEATLAALGRDSSQLAFDSSGTIIWRSNEPIGKPAPLPILRTENDQETADVRLQQLLGEGGMGRVLSAEQVALRREVAVKIARDPEGAGSLALLREALVIGRLEHPNIVPVHLLGRTNDGAALFVMKRIEGLPWSAVLRSEEKAKAFLDRSGVTTSEAGRLEFHLGVLLKVCDAISFAHAHNVLHRDLKPDNVMLGSYGEVYVVDWGLAVALRDEDPVLPLARTQTSIVGTPAYMAPEMATGTGPELSERTDVYLLGAILHELLTGAPPHQSTSVFQQLSMAFESVPPTFSPETPEELASICTRAMARLPKDRFASVEELRRALLEYRRHEASWMLSREADLRAENLLPILENIEPEPTDLRASTAPLRDTSSLLNECRFGYAQALHAWPENPAARRGLQLLLEKAIEHYLHKDLPDAAAPLLSELPTPRPELVARIEAQHRAHLEERKRRLTLEKLQHDADASVAQQQRTNATRALGVFWFLSGIATEAAERAGYLRLDYPFAITALLFYAALIISIGAMIRRREKINQAHERIMLAAIYGTVAMPIHWIASWLMGVSFQHTLVLFMFVVAIGWAVFSAFTDRRALLTAVSFFVGGVLIAVFPSLRIVWFSLTVLTGFGLVSVLLQPQRSNSKPES